MTTQSLWLWIGGVIVVAAAALALGTPPETLLILAVILACPAAMYFMMRGHGRQQEPNHAEMNRHTEIPEPRRPPQEQERQTTQTKYGERP